MTALGPWEDGDRALYVMDTSSLDASLPVGVCVASGDKSRATFLTIDQAREVVDRITDIIKQRGGPTA